MHCYLRHYIHHDWSNMLGAREEKTSQASPAERRQCASSFIPDHVVAEVKTNDRGVGLVTLDTWSEKTAHMSPPRSALQSRISYTYWQPWGVCEVGKATVVFPSPYSLMPCHFKSPKFNGPVPCEMCKQSTHVFCSAPNLCLC